MLKSANSDLSGYNYGAISSLVLTADRSMLPRRDKESDGAPISLAGRIDPKEMGSSQSPKDLEKKKRKTVGDKQEPSEKQFAKRKAEAAGFGYADIIEVAQHVEGLTYRPRTVKTREVYQLILSSVHTALGDQAQDIVRSAADAVLETLKNDSLKASNKKKEIEEVIGNISNEQLSQFITLSKKITDYNAEGEDTVNPDIERKEAEIDEEGGVAVVFDEEDWDDDDDEGFEIREESDEEDEEEQGDGDIVIEGEAREEDLVLGGESSRTVKPENDIVSPHSIDTFWVQSQISEIYPNPVTAADKAASVLSILGSESSARDCENQLMELFDYQSFRITAKFLKNRDIVVWCTKLMQSDADERVNVEVTMCEKGHGWILRELSGD
jgi:pre-mRNA-splicing helicase BRR2